MHACRCLRRSSELNRSATALPFFPALSCLLSSWSSLLTVALCFLQSRFFSRQRAKIFKKVCLFLGGRWKPCRSSCRWRRLSVSTAYDRFINAAQFVRGLDKGPSFLDPFQNEWNWEKDRAREERVTEWVSAGWVTPGGRRGEEREREREREIASTNRQKKRSSREGWRGNQGK